MQVDSAKSLGSDRRCASDRSVQLFAPGRLNLVGEHTDYNGGKVLPFCIDLGLEIKAELFNDQSSLVRVFSSSFEQLLQVSWAELRDVELKAIRDPWVKYVIGALLCVLPAMSPSAGLDVVIGDGLPVGAGLSSSAALCVGLLSAFAYLTQATWTAAEIAKQAQAIEHNFVGTRCGLMDQLAILHGQQQDLLLIDFDPESLQATGLPYSMQTIALHPIFEEFDCLVVNSNVKHSLAESAYNARRADCERGLNLLQAHYQQPFSSLGSLARPELFEALFELPRAAQVQADLKALLEQRIFRGEENRQQLASRCAHAIVENFRVDLAIEAVVKGSVSNLHLALDQSHASLRDDFEVSCPEIEFLRAEIRARAVELGKEVGFADSVIGPRMCGGGFGGSLIALVRRSIAGNLVESLGSGTAYEAQYGLKPQAYLVRLSSGLQTQLADLLEN